MRQVLAGLDENKDNAKALTDFLKRVVRGANEQGNARQGNIFGESGKATTEEIVKAARGVKQGGSDEGIEENAKKSTEKPISKPKREPKRLALTEQEEELLKQIKSGKRNHIDTVIENIDDSISMPQIMRMLQSLEEKVYINGNEDGGYIRTPKGSTYLKHGATEEEVTLPEGYRTESGRPLSECEAKDTGVS